MYEIDDVEKRTMTVSFKVKPSVRKLFKKVAKIEKRSVTSLFERALVDYCTIDEGNND
jgi:uncharacterized protein (DUF1778 family)